MRYYSEDDAINILRVAALDVIDRLTDEMYRKELPVEETGLTVLGVMMLMQQAELELRKQEEGAG